MARIRELTQKDIPETVQILAASEPVFKKGEGREDVQKLLQSAIGRGIIYVAEEESQVAAVVYFIPEPIFAPRSLRPLPGGPPGAAPPRHRPPVDGICRTEDLQPVLERLPVRFNVQRVCAQILRE